MDTWLAVSGHFGAFTPSVAAGVAAALLLAIAALHFVWASGSSFPTADRRALVATVVGGSIDQQMPGQVATAIVAIGLTLAAWWAAALGGLVPEPVPSAWMQPGGLAIVAIFGARGIGGFFEARLRPSIRGTPYLRYNQILYSPLAVLIAVLVACTILA